MSQSLPTPEEVRTLLREIEHLECPEPGEGPCFACGRPCAVLVRGWVIWCGCEDALTDQAAGVSRGGTARKGGE